MRNLDIGFVILNPDRNQAFLKASLASIKNNAYNRESICIVGNNVTAKEVKEMKELCPVFKGDDTITSLINVGLKKTKHDWAFLLFAGSRIQRYLERKLATVCMSDSDVLYPVVNRICNFVEGSFNGVMINTKFFQQVGDFPAVALSKENINDFEFAKLMWSLTALKQGVKLKGIVGLEVR